MTPPKAPQAFTLTWLTIVRIASIPALGIAAYTLFGVYDLQRVLQESWMDAHIRNQGLAGVGLYIGLVTVLTGLGVPRQILSFLGGYVFGVVLGTLWATIGTSLACALTFGYARFVGQTALQKRWGARLKPFNDFLCQAPFVLTTVVRIVPLGSNFLTNLAAGVSTIPALPFLSGSCAGFVVQNAIFALMGSGLRFSTTGHAVLSAVLYVLSLSLGYWVYRRYKRGRQI